MASKAGLSSHFELAGAQSGSGPANSSAFGCQVATADAKEDPNADTEDLKLAKLRPDVAHKTPNRVKY